MAFAGLVALVVLPLMGCAFCHCPPRRSDRPAACGTFVRIGADARRLHSEQAAVLAKNSGFEREHVRWWSPETLEDWHRIVGDMWGAIGESPDARALIADGRYAVLYSPDFEAADPLLEAGRFVLVLCDLDEPTAGAVVSESMHWIRDYPVLR